MHPNVRQHQLPLMSGDDTATLLAALKESYQALREVQPLLHSLDSLLRLRRVVDQATNHSRAALETITGTRAQPRTRSRLR
jgi:hypothetical protein